MLAGQSGPDPGGFGRLLRAAEIDARMFAMLVALAGIWLALDIASDGIFFSARNLYNLAVQSSVVGIMATGMVLVIVARHIDLSVGSLLGFTGMAMATLQVEILPVEAGWNWPVAMGLGLGLCRALHSTQSLGERSEFSYSVGRDELEIRIREPRLQVP